MDQIKRILGLLWMIIGPLAIGFLFLQASHKLASATATTNDYLQWGIIILIFLPISAGFMIFGYYGLKGEYDVK